MKQLLLGLVFVGGAWAQTETDSAAPRETPRELAARVDALLAQAWEAADLTPSRQARPAEFLRRLSLDVQGTTPRPDVVRAYLDGKDDDARRERLLTSMLWSQGYAQTMAERWANQLVGRSYLLDRGGARAPLSVWLAQQFAANRPWDEVVRALLGAQGPIAERGAGDYFRRFRGAPAELAGNAAQVFLGRQLQCAQCHDHPFEEEVTQREFWQLAAFFARVAVRDEAVVERPRGEVRLGGEGEVVAPRLFAQAPAPTQPRRERLAALITGHADSGFARATVARTWTFFFAEPLVDPDDVNRTSAFPAVLELLVEDFRQGYDMRRLVSTLVLTRAYGLTSHGQASPAALEAFAARGVRPLTPEQLWRSLAQTLNLTAVAQGDDPEGAERRLTAWRRQFFALFARDDRSSPADNTVAQALALINGPLLNQTVGATTPDSLLKQLLALPRAQRLEELFLRVLARPPTPAESRALRLSDASSDEERAFLHDVIWALFNSSEFFHTH
ncbi:MAG: DUF1549 domain-containing protein [Planctomycetes bacterium]|nr:DUF1549 domain-containing protein [Planctomycetota bacterium]